MPLNVRRFPAAVFAVLAGFTIFAGAQTVPQPTPATPVVTQPSPPAPTSGDVMRERISKAKAFIVVRNYNAAIYELENIRKESADAAVLGVVNVLLMNSYLEQGDYKRAQDLLTEFYTQQKTTKAGASASYMAVAGQVIKGARSRVERYRALGLSVSDRTLPLEATNDLEKMRETLELVITQSKEIGANKDKTPDAMMLLEEASSSRSMLARDDYDSRRWKDEVADTREQVASSRAVVLNAVTETPAGTDNIPANTAGNTPAIVSVAVTQPNATREREVKVSDSTTDINKVPLSVPTTVTEEVKPTPIVQQTGGPKVGDTVDMGSSLREYATVQPQPVYPVLARNMRTTGIVTVEVTIDEKGQVAKVEKTSGPSMLQAAAQDAIKRWKFKPFVRDGQPVRATGFVNFNFKL